MWVLQLYGESWHAVRMGVPLSELINPEQEARLRAVLGGGDTATSGDDGGVVEEVKDASSTEIEHKADPGVGGAQVLAADDETGIVEALVSVTGVKDRVNDIIEPGAYTKTLAAREPIGVWSHDDKTWVARTEEARELMPGDPFFRGMKTMDGKPWPAEAGAVHVKARFNLETPHGKAAYSDVKFFQGKTGWSIGYRATKAYRNPRTGVRNIKELDWFEYSPVMVGAASQPMTLSVKSFAQPVDHEDPTGFVGEEVLEQLSEAELDAFDELKASLGLEVKARHVRTPEGARMYGQPIGSTIRADVAKEHQDLFRSVAASGVSGEAKRNLQRMADMPGYNPHDNSHAHGASVALRMAAYQKQGSERQGLIDKANEIMKGAGAGGRGGDAQATSGAAPASAPAGSAMSPAREKAVRALIDAAPSAPSHRQSMHAAMDSGDHGKAADLMDETGSHGSANAIRRAAGLPEKNESAPAGADSSGSGGDAAAHGKLVSAINDAKLTVHSGNRDKVVSDLAGKATAAGRPDVAQQIRESDGSSESLGKIAKDLHQAGPGGGSAAAPSSASAKPTGKDLAAQRFEGAKFGFRTAAQRAVDTHGLSGTHEVAPHPSGSGFTVQRKPAGGQQAVSNAAEGGNVDYESASDAELRKIITDRTAKAAHRNAAQRVLMRRQFGQKGYDFDGTLEVKLAHESLDRSPRSNWVQKAGQLPAYIQHIAKDIHDDHGLPLEQAIPIAISRVKKWAAGGDGVKPETRAKAAQAVAEWEALKAKAHAKYDSELLGLLEWKATEYMDAVEAAWWTLIEAGEVKASDVSSAVLDPSVEDGLDASDADFLATIANEDLDGLLGGDVEEAKAEDDAVVEFKDLLARGAELKASLDEEGGGDPF